MLMKLKHLMNYLSQFDAELPIGLDKDGWQNEYPPEFDEDYEGPQVEDGTEIEVLKNSGLFYIMKDCIIINN